jgi:hypothetical protein
MPNFENSNHPDGEFGAGGERKAWSTPRVIVSDVRQGTAGGTAVDNNENVFVSGTHS